MFKLNGALRHPCPRCRVQIGQPCRNYKGGGMAPHRERQALENRRLAIRVARAASKRVGPLFDGLPADGLPADGRGSTGQSL